jgi:hypothetical protein
MLNTYRHSAALPPSGNIRTSSTAPVLNQWHRCHTPPGSRHQAREPGEQGLASGDQNALSTWKANASRVQSKEESLATRTGKSIGSSPSAAGPSDAQLVLSKQSIVHAPQQLSITALNPATAMQAATEVADIDRRLPSMRIQTSESSKYQASGKIHSNLPDTRLPKVERSSLQYPPRFQNSTSQPRLPCSPSLPIFSPTPSPSEQNPPRQNSQIPDSYETCMHGIPNAGRFSIRLRGGEADGVDDDRLATGRGTPKLQSPDIYSSSRGLIEDSWIKGGTSSPSVHHDDVVTRTTLPQTRREIYATATTLTPTSKDSQNARCSASRAHGSHISPVQFRTCSSPLAQLQQAAYRQMLKSREATSMVPSLENGGNELNAGEIRFMSDTSDTTDVSSISSEIVTNMDSFAVFDDSEPPSLQPQTPADLNRRLISSVSSRSAPLRFLHLSRNGSPHLYHRDVERRQPGVSNEGRSSTTAGRGRSVRHHSTDPMPIMRTQHTSEAEKENSEEAEHSEELQRDRRTWIERGEASRQGVMDRTPPRLGRFERWMHV